MEEYVAKEVHLWLCVPRRRSVDWPLIVKEPDAKGRTVDGPFVIGVKLSSGSRGWSVDVPRDRDYLFLGEDQLMHSHDRDYVFLEDQLMYPMIVIMIFLEKDNIRIFLPLVE